MSFFFLFSYDEPPLHWLRYALWKFYKHVHFLRYIKGFSMSNRRYLQFNMLLFSQNICFLPQNHHFLWLPYLFFKFPIILIYFLNFLISNIIASRWLSFWIFLCISHTFSLVILWEVLYRPQWVERAVLRCEYAGCLLGLETQA